MAASRTVLISLDSSFWRSFSASSWESVERSLRVSV